MGDLLLDLVVKFDPESGEADTAADAVQLWPGGSAANFTVWAARQGASVRFVSRVGRDFAGEMLVRSLEEAGVTPAVRMTDETATGRVLVTVDSHGARKMWSYAGASAAISPDDLDPAWFANLDAFHLTGYSLLREGPRAAAHEALHLARQSGALCTLDPNPSHLIVDFGTDLYRATLERLQFDIIFPNREEGVLLTGRERPYEIARALLALSPMVVLTLGDQGCLVARGDDVFEVRAEPVGMVRDVTGAGDAFAAGFVVEYLRSRDVLSAARSGNRLAATVVGQMGAR